MGDKAKAVLMMVIHTILSFVAAFFAGLTFNVFFRPVIGRERYRVIAKSPVMVVLLLVVVALWGMILYEKWHDRRAFLAWVLPAMWIVHILLSRGVGAFLENWADNLFFFAVGAAYSVGAIVSAMVIKRQPQRLH